MSESTLKLGAHELFFAASGTPSMAPATQIETEIAGHQRVFLLRLEPFELGIEGCDAYTAFFRARAEPQSPILGVRWVTRSSPKKPSPDAKLAQLWCENSVKSARPARLWHAANAPYGLALSPDGIAEIVWPSSGGKSVESLTFRWRPLAANATDDSLQTTEIRTWPQVDLEAFCQALTDDDSSGLNQALRWQQLPDAERDAIAFGCQDGNWEGLLHLSQLALTVVTGRHGLFPTPRLGHSYRQLDFRFSPRGDRPQDLAVRHNNRLQDAICALIQPAFWPVEPLFVYSWRGEEGKATRTVKCEMPSQKLCLEAESELREFLRPHLGDQETEALLHDVDL